MAFPYLDFPKEEQPLPSRVLSVDETELILNQPDVTTPLGLRDRAIPETLFVSCNGRPFGASNLSILVRSNIERAGIAQSGSCHMFRHAAATQMLHNGADIRSLQALLGH